MSYKPDGYNSVSPYLLVSDARGTLAFLAEAFGAERLRLIEGEDGGIAHAEARIDDSVVMMGEMDGAPAANVHLYVADVDGAFAKALEAGGMVVQEVREQGDGDRRGGVKDPTGTTWWISTQVA